MSRRRRTPGRGGTGLGWGGGGGASGTRFDAWLLVAALVYSASFLFMAQSLHSRLAPLRSLPVYVASGSSDSAVPAISTGVEQPRRQPAVQPPRPPPQAARASLPPPHKPTPKPPAPKGRALLEPEGQGCHKVIGGKAQCCAAIDGRVTEEFGYQDCVPAKSGQTFPSGNGCEPAMWVKSSPEARAVADDCPNGIGWDRPPNSAAPGGGAAAAAGLPAGPICERSLGDGFSMEWPVCGGDGGRARGVCRHNRDTGGTYCRFRDLEVRPSLVSVSEGGEEISAVMGRAEAREFPTYSRGAFSVACPEASEGARRKRQDNYFPHHLTKVMAALQHDQSDVCQGGDARAGPTMFFTRYEYANLFHQMTDWYNMFAVARKEQILDQPLAFLFLDGHAKGSLDSAWKLFSRGAGYERVKTLPGRVCFRDAIIMPMGYRSPVDVHGMNGRTLRCRGDARVLEFGHTVRDWVGVPAPVPPAQRTSRGIGIIFRRDYLAHPRQRSGRTTRKIVNEQNVVSALMSVRVSGLDIHVRSLSLEKIPFAQQVKLVTPLDLLIGVHGAALSLALWMQPKSHLIEISTAGYRARYHFKYFASWAGVGYTQLSASGGDSIRVDTRFLAEQVKSILQASRNAVIDSR